MVVGRLVATLQGNAWRSTNGQNQLASSAVEVGPQIGPATRASGQPTEGPAAAGGAMSEADALHSQRGGDSAGAKSEGREPVCGDWHRMKIGPPSIDCEPSG